MKHKITATPANNIHLGPCIMIAAFLDSGKEALLIVKTKKDPFVVCRRNEAIFFEADDFGQSSDIPLRISDACVTGALGDVACSCHIDSVAYLKKIQKHEIGIFLYLPHEGMGRGLSAKLSDHRLQLGLGVDGLNVHPMSFEESATIMFGDSQYDSRTYMNIKILFNQLRLDTFSFLYFGRNVGKMKVIQAETGLHLTMYSDNTNEH